MNESNQPYGSPDETPETTLGRRELLKALWRLPEGPLNCRLAAAGPVGQTGYRGRGAARPRPNLGVTAAAYSLDGSVWYNFTETSDSLIDADTFGRGYDTVLSVYTGERGALVQVTGGCNDDYNGFQSHVTFAANTGITYYFLIGRCCGNGGSGGGYLQFNVREIIRPANDDLAAATEISTLPFTDIVNNTDATLEPDESQPCPWAYDSYNTVWYKFTPERKMALRADMTGSNFGNTAITLFLDSGSGITPWACRFNGETMPILVEPGST